MIIGIDIGNTHVFFGLLENGKLIDRFRMSSRKGLTADEIGIFIKGYLNCTDVRERVEAVIISSVRPSLNYSFYHACVKFFDMEPFFIRPGVKTGLKIKIDNPKELGADRIANAVAATSLYGSPNIVIDFGTATTIDVVDSSSSYCGGLILPGIKLALKALGDFTEQLPQVEVRDDVDIIGKNTVEALQSGIIHGTCGSIEHILKMILRKKNMEGAKIIGTGGLAYLIEKKCSIFHEINSDLIMQGIHLIYEKNLPG
jgi:type III pantothenate kinase